MLIYACFYSQVLSVFDMSSIYRVPLLLIKEVGLSVLRSIGLKDGICTIVIIIIAFAGYCECFPLALEAGHP